jgi:putative ATPase
MKHPKHTPLAEILRPKALEEVIGQDHLVGKKGFLTHLIENGTPLSILLWGPPGCGKTSIARLYAQAFDCKFVAMSAVWDGVAELKRIIRENAETPLFNKGLMIFLDEIHRFNKAQQDALLPFVENGTIILIGATVENPSFYLNNALLSRVRVLTLNSLDEASLKKIYARAEEVQGPIPIDEQTRDFLIAQAQGDGRYLINLIENLQSLPKDKKASLEDVMAMIQKRAAHFDRGAEQHYNLISALHKSVRGSDPDAALYWLARMLEGGEEPLYIARRLIRMASEDIGLADPQALPLAIAARDAYEMLGSPEGELALAETVIYLALAPKSNASYVAYNQAREQATLSTHLPPPKHILNAPTRLMKQLGYGKGYEYDPDTPLGFSGQNYFPEGMERQHFYTPVERGFEREMRKRLDYFGKLRENLEENKE